MNIAGAFAETFRKFQEKVSIEFAGRKVTFGEIEVTTNKIANGLRELGVEKGDRIKIVLLGDYYNMAEIMITCNDESYKYYKMYKLSHELIVDITEEGEYKIGILLDGSAAKYRVYRWE